MPDGAISAAYVELRLDATRLPGELKTESTAAADAAEVSVNTAMAGVRDRIGVTLKETVGAAGQAGVETGRALAEGVSGAAAEFGRIPAAAREATAGIAGSMATAGEEAVAATRLSTAEITGLFETMAARIDRSFAETGVAIRGSLAGVGDRVAVSTEKAAAVSRASSSEIAAALAAGGATGGTKLAEGVERGASTTERRMEKTGGFLEKLLGEVGVGFTRFGNVVGRVGLPMAESFNKVGEKLTDTEVKAGSTFSKLSTLGGVVTAGLGAAFAVVGGESLKAQVEFQTATSEMAANANLPIKAAQAIGNAMLDTGGKSIFSAQQQMKAYGQVASQLANVQGHALTTREAMQFMQASMDLAEESGTNLGAATKTLSQIMQTFQVPLSEIDKTTTVLFNTSRITSTSVEALGNTMDRLKTRLGVAAPTVADMASLIVDLGQHGVVGQRGLLVVNSAMTTLLNSTDKLDAAQKKAAEQGATKVAAAQTAVQKATEALRRAQESAGVSADRLSVAQAKAADSARQKVVGAEDAVAKATDNLKLAQDRQAQTAGKSAIDQEAAAARVRTAQESLASAHQRLAAAQQAATATAGPLASGTDRVRQAQETLAAAQEKLQAAQSGVNKLGNANLQTLSKMGIQVYTAGGQFVGFREILAQLSPKIDAMKDSTGRYNTQAQLQALGAIFGTQANKALLATVIGGVPAYDRAQKAVNDSAAAHHALEVQAKTAGHQLEQMGTAVEDSAVRFGAILLPILSKVEGVFVSFGSVLLRHKDLLYAVAAVVGTVLAAAIGAFLINLARATIESAIDFAKMIAQAVVWAAETAVSIGETLYLWGLYAAEWIARTVPAMVTFVAENAAKLAVWVAETAASVATTLALWASYAAEWVATQIPAMATFIAEHTAMVAAFVAENAVMIASAVAAFVAENLATLGIAAALAVLVGAIVYVATHWKQTWDEIKRIFDDAVSFLRSGFGTLVVLIVAGPLAPLLLLALHWQQVWSGMKAAVKAVVDFVGEAVSFVRRYAVEIAAGMAVLLGPLGLMIGVALLVATHWRQVWSAITMVTREAWTLITGFVRVGVNALLTVIGPAMSIIRSVFTAGWILVAGVVRAAWILIRGLVEAPLRIIQGLIAVGMNVIEGHWGRAWAALTAIPGRVLGAVGSAVAGALVVLGSSVVRAGTVIIGGFYRAVLEVVRIFEMIGRLIVGAVATAWRDLVNAGEAIVKAIISGIESAGSGIGKAILSHIPGAGLVQKGIGAIAGLFDTGGFVPGSAGSPQLIVAHAGEYILSLDQMSRLRAATQATTNGPAPLSQALGIPAPVSAVTAAGAPAAAGGTAAPGEAIALFRQLVDLLARTPPLQVNYQIETSDPVRSAVESVNELQALQSRRGR